MYGDYYWWIAKLCRHTRACHQSNAVPARQESPCTDDDEYGALLQVLYYVRSFLHIEALWFANVANQLMW